LIVGFETRDDAAIFRLNNGVALVQTLDFFTPIVDDPYAYGQIAAANALSDVYAMGGTPITAMNIMCFDPAMAPKEVWALIIRGMAEKVTEAGAVTIGGHTVLDSQPKFGLSVTGTVDPGSIFSNTQAYAGQGIYLSKPLGTGIIATAAKNDRCDEEYLRAAIDTMSRLNADACNSAKKAGVKCATDITGFGLAGHLMNIAQGSRVSIILDASTLPLLPGVEELIRAGQTTGGACSTTDYLRNDLTLDKEVPEWILDVCVDPQTSGGLLVCANSSPAGFVKIGVVSEGAPRIRVS